MTFPIGDWDGWNGVANYVVFQDASDTPKTSPLAANTTHSLVIPRTAFKLVVKAKTSTVDVKQTADAGKFEIAAGETQEFDCAGHEGAEFPTTIDIVASATGVPYFYFKCLTKNGQ